MATKKAVAKKKTTKKKVVKKTARKVVKKQTKQNGRPTMYRAKYAEMVYRLCMLGAIDKDLADFFKVSEQTINVWKKKHPKFVESMRRGKLEADCDVAISLYERATGYSHPEEKIFQHDGEIIRADTTKHYPPETAAIKHWLNNRRPEFWRDRIELAGPKEQIDVPESPEEVQKQIDYWQNRIKFLEAQL